MVGHLPLLLHGGLMVADVQGGERETDLTRILYLYLGDSLSIVLNVRYEASICPSRWPMRYRKQPPTSCLEQARPEQQGRTGDIQADHVSEQK
jgi:hypothetical protein